MRHIVRLLAASLCAALAAAGVWAQTSAPLRLPPLPARPLASSGTTATQRVAIPNVPAAPDAVVTPPIVVPRALPPAVAVAPVPAVPAEDPFRWDATSKVLNVKPGALSANFSFFVTNVSASEVLINSLATSCGCTVAQLPPLPAQPFKLLPGAFTKIDVTMDLVGKSGTLVKTVTVQTSAGQRTLMVTANVPAAPPASENVTMNGERLLNQALAKSDRQAVFRGECAKCHFEPTLGKTGEALFTAACGVCHLSEHRATMVTDLATLKVPTNVDYWRLWIKYGKVGTLMPAWDQAQGGPLTQQQIDSLAEYLVQRYPNKVASNQ